MPREAEWESRWWSPIINAEHLAMRDRVAMIDLTAFAIFDVVGPGVARVPRSGVALAEVRRAGRARDLHADPERARRLQVRPDDHAARRARTSASSPAGCRRPARLQVVPRQPARGRVGVAARRHVGLVHGRRLGAARARPARVGDERRRLARGLPVRALPRARDRARCACSPRASRTSATSAGSCTRRWSSGRALWDVLWEAGQPLGVVPAGIGVYGTTGRIEKGYRLFGAELESEYDVVEAGMQRPTVKEADFVGKDAYVRAPRGGAGGAAVHADGRRPRRRRPGVKRYMLGPRADPDAGRRADRRPQGPRLVRDVRRARGRPSASTSCWPTCRPSTRSRAGTCSSQYMGERYPVTVDVVGLAAALRSRERPHPLRERPRLRQARARDRGADRADAGRAGDRHALPRHTISPHEECAVEEALRIGGEGHDDGADARPAGRGGAAAGRDRDGDRRRRSCSRPTARDWDPQATAAAIADAVRRRDFDLLLFGNESADSGGYQVGIRVAHALGLPVVTGVKGIERRRRGRDGAREAGGGWEVFETAAPGGGHACARGSTCRAIRPCPGG